MTDENTGTETLPADDANFMIVQGMIYGGAVLIVGGLFVLIVAILLTI